MDTDTTRRIIRAARTLLQWDQERFAVALGVGVATLKRFEAGYPVTEANVTKMLDKLRETGIAVIDEGSIRGDRITAGVALLRSADVGEAVPLRKDAKSGIRKKGRRRPPEDKKASEPSDHPPVGKPNESS